MNTNLLTIKEASEYLAIKQSTLRSAIFNKKIKYIKIGRLVRFRLDDLHEYIQKNTKDIEN